MRSPYEEVHGDLVAGLHPRLQPYFRGIPPGFHGVGTGTFSTVGTPRRWLWPVLAVLQRQGVLFPVWERDVPFTVVNRPARDERGWTAVTAIRTFHTRSGDRRMVDAITAEAGGLVDYLGASRRYRAVLTASTDSGGLVLAMTGMAIRIGSRWLSVPRWASPRLTVSERFDEKSGLQDVAVITTMPLLGRVYEYAGSFSYELRPDHGGTE